MSHDTNTIDSRTHEGQLNKLGFWIFLDRICIIRYPICSVINVATWGSYGGKMTTELFELPLVLIMTFALLISSYTCGIAIYYLRKEEKAK